VRREVFPRALAADALLSLRGLRREKRVLSRRISTLGQTVMNDFANAERHIGDEMRAREHIQDRKFRDICPAHWQIIEAHPVRTRCPLA
jgi:hypothetical protein